MHFFVFGIHIGRWTETVGCNALKQISYYGLY